MKKFIDQYRHKGLRQKLVKEISRKGISDKSVLNAIGEIPRHFFLDDAFEDWAYKDVAFPIEADQTISQPYTVAFQTQLLKAKRGHRVLEVGTGSGYQACVLAQLGAKVYTIERHEKLFEKTSTFLPAIGFPEIRTLLGDGFEGAPRFAPFDRILVTAGAQEIPEKLIDQLKVDGIMVIPMGSKDDQWMYRIIKKKDRLVKEKHGRFRFVPMLKGIEKLEE